MKTLFPLHTVFTFWLLIMQTYLLVYIVLLALRGMKLLKRPYSGMDYAELLPASVILLSTLLISSADASGILQAAKFYSDKYSLMKEPFILFFARSFMVVLFFNLLFIVLNFLNIRFWFRDNYNAASIPVSLLLCAISLGFAIVCWFTCREVVDNMTPRLIDFQ